VPLCVDAPPAEEDELLELPPHAAMNVASPVAATPAPIDLPAIFKNFLRSTSSRANCSIAPPSGRSTSELIELFTAPPSAHPDRSPGLSPLYGTVGRTDHKADDPSQRRCTSPVTQALSRSSPTRVPGRGPDRSRTAHQ